MPLYNVIVTRDLTESVSVEVEAETRGEAEALALEVVYKSACDPAHLLNWETDEGNFSEPYIGAPGEAELVVCCDHGAEEGPEYDASLAACKCECHD